MLMLEEGCQKIEGFPMGLAYRDVDDFWATQTTTTKATTETTIQPKIGGKRKTFYFVYNKLENIEQDTKILFK